MAANYDEQEEFRARFETSLRISNELSEFSDSKDIFIVLGTVICTWCTQKGYSPQEVALELCNDICDIQDMLDGLSGSSEIGGNV